MDEQDEVRDVVGDDAVDGKPTSDDVASVDVTGIDVVAALRQAAPPRRTSRRWLRVAGMSVAALALLVVTAAAVVGLSRTHRAPHAQPNPVPAVTAVPSVARSLSATPAVADAPETPDWTAVLAALDDVRAAAFARADTAMLANVYLNGSTAARSDAAVIASLRHSALHADGFVLKVLQVTPQQPVSVSDRVRLLVVDERPAFRWLDASGRLIGTQPARGPAQWSIELVRGGAAGWLVADVKQATVNPAMVKPAMVKPAVTSPAAQPRANPQSSGR
jgi:hypothetical protein